MPVIARASLVEFFKDQVEGALARQHVPAAGDTAHYVVQLLAGAARLDTQGRAGALLDPRPLAVQLAAAMDERCAAPDRALRDVADAALLLGGYFASRAGARHATGYYRTVGGLAYATLGKAPQALAPVFQDLAGRFAEYAGALDEVGQRATMQTPGGLVRALEAWCVTRDRTTERLLVERGVVLPQTTARLQ